MPQLKEGSPPDTLPGDYFDKQGKTPPTTLPGDYFDRPTKAPKPRQTEIAPVSANSFASSVGLPQGRAAQTDPLSLIPGGKQLRALRPHPLQTQAPTLAQQMQAGPAQPKAQPQPQSGPFTNLGEVAARQGRQRQVQGTPRQPSIVNQAGDQAELIKGLPYDAREFIKSQSAGLSQVTLRNGKQIPTHEATKLWQQTGVPLPTFNAGRSESVLDDPEFYRSVYGALPPTNGVDKGLIGHDQFQKELYAPGSDRYKQAETAERAHPRVGAYAQGIANVGNVVDQASYFIPGFGEARFALESANAFAKDPGDFVKELAQNPVMIGGLVTHGVFHAIHSMGSDAAFAKALGRLKPDEQSAIKNAFKASGISIDKGVFDWTPSENKIEPAKAAIEGKPQQQNAPAKADLTETPKKIEEKVSAQKPEAATRLYHGTDSGAAIRKQGFKIGAGESPYVGGATVHGVYLSPDEAHFKEGGMLEGASHVLPVDANLGKVYETDLKGMVELEKKHGSPKAIADALQKEGYDSVKLTHLDGHEFIVFDPERLKLAEEGPTPGNEKPTKLAPDEPKTTDTKTAKRPAAEPKMADISADTKPLYHGTNSAFEGNPKAGSWYSETPDHADFFAKRYPNRGPGRVIKQDVNLGKVLDLSDHEVTGPITTETLAKKLGLTSDELLTRIGPEKAKILIDNERFGGTRVHVALEDAGVADLAKELGYDSIKASEKTNAKGDLASTYKVLSDQLPGQTSPTAPKAPEKGNDGAFDPEVPLKDQKRGGSLNDFASAPEVQKRWEPFSKRFDKAYDEWEPKPGYNKSDRPPQFMEWAKEQGLSDTQADAAFDYHFGRVTNEAKAERLEREGAADKAAKDFKFSAETLNGPLSEKDLREIAAKFHAEENTPSIFRDHGDMKARSERLLSAVLGHAFNVPEGHPLRMLSLQVDSLDDLMHSGVTHGKELVYQYFHLAKDFGLGVDLPRGRSIVDFAPKEPSALGAKPPSVADLVAKHRDAEDEAISRRASERHTSKEPEVETAPVIATQHTSQGLLLHSAEGYPFYETRLPTDRIGVKKGLQYKESEITDSENQVSGRYKGVGVYDEGSAKQLTVWQDNDGKNWVVNGHHRLEIAKRTAHDSVGVHLYRETDGITFDDARAIGALQNIREGNGAAIDAVGVLKKLGFGAEKLKQIGVPLKDSVGRDALGIAKLPDEGIDMVRRGDVSEQAAAAIGHADLSPERTMGAMKKLHVDDITGRRQAEFIAEKARSAPMSEKVDEGDLFGDVSHEFAWGEQAKIADKVLTRLVGDERLYKAILKGRGVGETVVDEAAQSHAAAVQEFGRKVIATDPEVSRILEAEAVEFAKNPTSARLSEAVERVSEAARTASERRLAELGQTKPGSTATSTEPRIPGAPADRTPATLIDHPQDFDLTAPKEAAKPKSASEQPSQLSLSPEHIGDTKGQLGFGDSLNSNPMREHHQAILVAYRKAVSSGRAITLSNTQRIVTLTKLDSLFLSDSGEIRLRQGNGSVAIGETSGYVKQLETQLGVKRPSGYTEAYSEHVANVAKADIARRETARLAGEQKNREGIAKVRERAQTLLKTGVNPESGKPLTKAQIAELQKVLADTAPKRTAASVKAEAEAINIKGVSQGKTRAATIHPEDWVKIVKKGALYVEYGYRTFAEAMVMHYGDWIKPHLEALWKEAGGKEDATQEKQIESRVQAEPEGGTGSREKEVPGTGDSLQRAAEGGKEDRKTGLANVVQVAESERGIFSEIDATRGKTPEEWQAEGKRIVDEGSHPDADYEDLAHRVSTGSAELTGQRVGILLEGKRRILKEIESAKKKLDASPGNQEGIDGLDAARQKLQNYLHDVQQGKGRWSDVGRALQAGTNIDLGNFEEVLGEVNRRHKNPDPGAVKAIEDLSGKYKQAQEDLAAQELENKRLRAEAEVAASRKAGRHAYTKDDAQKEIQRILAEHKKAYIESQGALHANPIVGVSKVSAATVKALAEVGNVYLKLGASSLEELIGNVLTHFEHLPASERLGKQDVIDAMAGSGEKRTISDAARQRMDIRRQIAKDSPAYKEALSKARKAEAEAMAERRKAGKLTNADKRKMANAAAEVKKSAATKAAAEAKRLKKSLEDAKKEHDDLSKQMKEGRFRKESVAERKGNEELLNIQARNRNLKRAIKGAIAHADKSKWSTAAQRILQIPRSTAVLGHVVGMVTHAGRLAFSPQDWGNWGRGFVEQFRAAVSPKFHERMMQDMEGSPNHGTALRYGLDVGDVIHDDVSRYQEGLGKFLGGFGTRAMDALKALRQRAWDQEAAKYSSSEMKEVGHMMADLMNHSTGYAKNKLGIFSKGMFAPSLEQARWWTIGDTYRGAKLTAKVVRGRATAAEVKLWKFQTGRAVTRTTTYLGALGLNYGLNVMTGHGDDNVNFTDPRKNDWLRFKIAGKTLDPIGGAMSPVHFLAGIAQTFIMGSRDPRMGRAEALYEQAGSYARGKLNPTLGMGADVATRTDFQGNALPNATESEKAKALGKGKKVLTWPEYFAQRAPIPVAGAFREYFEQMAEKAGNPFADAVITFAFEGLGGKVGKSDKTNYRMFELEQKEANAKAGGAPLTAAEAKEYADYTEAASKDRLAKQTQQLEELRNKAKSGDKLSEQEQNRVERLEQLVEQARKRRPEGDQFTDEMKARGLNQDGTVSKSRRR